MGRLLPALLAVLLLVVPATAQTDRARTLADIRQELSVLYVEIQRLGRELSTTGGAQTGVAGSGSITARIETLEAEVTRVIAQVERLELRIDSIVRDGTNRIGDLEFRLVELEGGDTSRLGRTTTLGGDAPVTDLPTLGGSGLAPPGGDAGGGQLAVAERDSFERAKALHDGGDYLAAAEAFEEFVQTYPGGPLSGEAHFRRGEARAQIGQWRLAARAFLDGFSGAPEGPYAARSLLNLGRALDRIDQRTEACLTLNEVRVRFPGDPAADEASREMTALECP